MTAPLTFYGHFTGHSSFPVVCNAIARWLLSRGYDFRVVNLRELAVADWLRSRQIRFTALKHPNKSVWQSAGGVSLLFAFPAWHAAIPRHDHVIGYHVPDVTPAPPSWFGLIEANCDTVLTPSKWCSHLLRNTLGVTKPVHVVRHGIDPDVFTPRGVVRGNGKVLRHFCSSLLLDRKGTKEVVGAAERLIQEREDATVCVSAPNEVLYLLNPDGERAAVRGSRLSITSDQPTAPDEIAQVLRGSAAIVQPSRAEGFGLLGLEAAACGTPIVATSCTGHAEWARTVESARYHVRTLDDGRCGAGAAPRIDQESLYSAMLRAIDERAERRARAVEASAGVRRAWAWSAVLDSDLAPVLKSVLG